MFEVVRLHVNACNVISKYWRFRFGRSTLPKLIAKLQARGIVKSVLKNEFCMTAKKKLFSQSNVRLIHEVMVRIVVLALHFVDRHLLNSFELKVGYFASAYLYSVFPDELLFANEKHETTKLMVEKAIEFTDCFESICSSILQIPRTSSYFSKELVLILQTFLALVNCYHYCFDLWRPSENERILVHAKVQARMFYQWNFFCPTPYLQCMLKKYSDKIIQLESRKALEEWLSTVPLLDTFDISINGKSSHVYCPVPMFHYNVLHAFNLDDDFELNDNGSSNVDSTYFWMYSVYHMFSVSELETTLSLPSPKYSCFFQMLRRIQEIFNLYFFEDGIIRGCSGVDQLVEKMKKGTFQWADVHGLVKIFARELYHVMQIYSFSTLDCFPWKKVMTLSQDNIKDFCVFFFQMFECLQKMAIKHVNSEVQHLKKMTRVDTIRKERLLFDKIFFKSVSTTILSVKLVLDRYDVYHAVLNVHSKVSKDVQMILNNDLKSVYFFHCSMFLEMWSDPTVDAVSCPETWKVDWKQLEMLRKRLNIIILKAHVLDKTEEFLNYATNSTSGSLFSKEDISKVIFMVIFNRCKHAAKTTIIMNV